MKQSAEAQMRQIADGHWYIPASEEPLSADIGIISGERYLWLYDVGNGTRSREQLQTARNRLAGESRPQGQPCCAVLSHFHPDHIGNIDSPELEDCERIYVSANTFGYLRPAMQKKAVLVESPLEIRDGAELVIFPIPSSHARGCLGLMVERREAWIGDAAYTGKKNGRAVYNANLLREQIALFEELEADTFLLSHRRSVQVKKGALLRSLRECYSARNPDSAYIEVT